MVKKSFPFLTCCRFDQWKFLLWLWVPERHTLKTVSNLFIELVKKWDQRQKALCLYFCWEHNYCYWRNVRTGCKCSASQEQTSVPQFGLFKESFLSRSIFKKIHQRILSLVSNNIFRRLFSISLSSNSQLTLNQLEINEKLTVSTAVTSPLCCPPAAAAVWWWRRQRLQICSRSRS